MPPFPYIEDIKNLENITGINDVLTILGMVYKTVPWTVIPYTKEIRYTDIEPLYLEFKDLKIGGWCGLNAEFFKWIIEGYGYIDKTLIHRSHNFGFPSTIKPAEKGPQYDGFTHVGVTIELDRAEFFFDPYFCRYFIHADGYPLQFKDLLFLIINKKFDRYKSVFLPVKKPVIRETGEVDYIEPQQLLEEVFEHFNRNGLSELLLNTFGIKNPDSLMLLKIPD